MKRFVAVAFIAGVGLAVVSPVQAMPIAPLDQPEAGNVIQVFGGCGWRASGPVWWMPAALQLSGRVAYRTVGPRLQTELEGLTDRE
jgi:hypothetical protein